MAPVNALLFPQSRVMLIPPPPHVDTSAFILRAWSVNDASALSRTLDVSDAHLRVWTPWVVDGRVPGLTLEERLRQHADAFASGSEWVYGIFSPNGAEVLGGCGLYPRIGPGVIEIGYWLSVTSTGRGLATQAAAILTRMAFAAPDIDRVEIHCHPLNDASARIPRRLGYCTTPRSTGATGDRAPDGCTIWSLTRMEFATREHWANSRTE